MKFVAIILTALIPISAAADELEDLLNSSPDLTVLSSQLKNAVTEKLRNGYHIQNFSIRDATKVPAEGPYEIDFKKLSCVAQQLQEIRSVVYQHPKSLSVAIDLESIIMPETVVANPDIKSQPGVIFSTPVNSDGSLALKDTTLTRIILSHTMSNTSCIVVSKEEIEQAIDEAYQKKMASNEKYEKKRRALELLKEASAGTAHYAAATRPGECNVGEVICNHDYEPKSEARSATEQYQVAEGPGANSAI